MDPITAGKVVESETDTALVSIQGLTEPDNVDLNKTMDGLNGEELAMIKMEAEEEQKPLQEEGWTEHEFELEHDENTEWLCTSEWPRWFHNRPLHIIAAASKTPSVQISAYSIGHWAGEELISLASHESALRTLMSLTDCVLERCEETLQSTPRSLRCWIKSSGPSVSPRPFEALQRNCSCQKYYKYLETVLVLHFPYSSYNIRV